LSKVEDRYKAELKFFEQVGFVVAARLEISLP